MRPRARARGPGSGECRALLLECFQVALQAVDGRRCVSRQLHREPLEGAWHVVAIGKAAAAMTAGALDRLGCRLARSLVVTTPGQAGPGLAQDARLAVIESSHPQPDARSLAAGEAVRDFVGSLARNARLLWLISGGASSLVELPVRGIGLEDLQRVNRWLLGSGLDIAAINAVRRRMSQLKGGGLAALATPRTGLAFLMSDVPEDDPAVIGSGLLHRSRRGRRLPSGMPADVAELLAAFQERGAVAARRVPYRIVASNTQARTAARRHARQCGRPVAAGRGGFSGDAATLGRGFARRLATVASDTVCVWGGESTVTLPAQPGRGGRNQHLALAAAIEMSGESGLCLLAAGTDGVDGASVDAGAVVDGTTFARGAGAGLDARDHLLRADSAAFLEECGALLYTGPTGSNVGDLVIGLRNSTQ